jgi:ABC-type polar amino acid transport system ATPase subunit
MQEKMAKISVNHLQKSYNGSPVLDGVSFAAQSGEIIALLGGSGAGKSTLLRCLNLLEKPSGGTVEIGATRLNFSDPNWKMKDEQQRALRAKVGMVFQQFNLWPHRTVLGNLIEAPMQVLKKSKEAAIEEAQTLLKQVGLSDKQNSYPGHLSGGQQQRVAIARALMMHPAVMLFDEPTSALDPKTVTELMVLIKALAQKGMTMIIATHEMGFARRTADQIIFLDQGKIVEKGKTGELFSHPQTAAFAHFIQGCLS